MGKIPKKKAFNVIVLNNYEINLIILLPIKLIRLSNKKKHTKEKIIKIKIHVNLCISVNKFNYV